MTALTTVDLTRVFVAAGYPEPVAEYQFCGFRKWKFDYAWVEYSVAFEREGGTWQGGRHNHGAGYRNDCVKYSEAAIGGWLVVRVTADMLRDGSAYSLLERALQARGWRPEGKR